MQEKFNPYNLMVSFELFWIVLLLPFIGQESLNLYIANGKEI